MPFKNIAGKQRHDRNVSAGLTSDHVYSPNGLQQRWDIGSRAGLRDRSCGSIFSNGRLGVSREGN